MGNAVPVGAQKPTDTGVHEVKEEMFVALDVVPARHGTGSAAPLLQKYPGRHGKHEVEPAVFWNVPAAHKAHSELAVLSVYVPGAHGVCLVDPVAQNEPRGQAMHARAFCRLRSFE